jgi:hypothetical protein
MFVGMSCKFSIWGYNKRCSTCPNFTVLTLVSLLRMSGAIPLRPLYAFMAWTETNYLYTPWTWHLAVWDVKDLLHSKFGSRGGTGEKFRTCSRLSGLPRMVAYWHNRVLGKFHAWRKFNFLIPVISTCVTGHVHWPPRSPVFIPMGILIRCFVDGVHVPLLWLLANIAGDMRAHWHSWELTAVLSRPREIILNFIFRWFYFFNNTFSAYSVQSYV